MSTITADESIHTIHYTQEIQIAAPIEMTFAAVLDELGPANEMPDGTPLPFLLEPWPGGRWFRDLGNNSGHFWGHVQVIKPPALLEIRGPLFMSYPAINFVQYRLTAAGGGTLLRITHRAFGQIPEDHREGLKVGFGHGLARIRQLAERKAAGRTN